MLRLYTLWFYSYFKDQRKRKLALKSLLSSIIILTIMYFHNNVFRKSIFQSYIVEICAILLEIRYLFINIFIYLFFWLKIKNKDRKKPQNFPLILYFVEQFNKRNIDFRNFFQDQLFMHFWRSFQPCICDIILTSSKIYHFRRKTRLFLPPAIYPELTTIIFPWTVFSTWHIVERLFELYEILLKILKFRAKNSKQVQKNK